MSSCPVPVELRWGERPQKGEFSSFQALVWAVPCTRPHQFLSWLWRCQRKDAGNKLLSDCPQLLTCPCSSFALARGAAGGCVTAGPFCSLTAAQSPCAAVSAGKGPAVCEKGRRPPVSQDKSSHSLHHAQPPGQLPAEGSPMWDNVEKKNKLYLRL